jgi:hypothetical protein
MRICALTEALSYNNSLCNLDVSHNRFDKHSAFALTETMVKPTGPLEPEGLIWDDNASVSEEGIA